MHIEFYKKFKIPIKTLHPKRLTPNPTPSLLVPNRLTLNANEGQAMVEVIIAMSVAVVGLVGVLSFISNSVGVSRVSTDQYIGSNLASEGLELVKNLIDRNAIQKRAWDDGLTPAGDYQMDYNGTALDSFSAAPLLINSSTGIYSYDSGIATKFIRKITIERVTADEIRAVSLVSWITRGGGAFNASAEELFFNHQ